MKKITVTVLFLLANAVAFGQTDSIFISGKVERISDARYISFGLSGIKIPIKDDGSFEYKDTIGSAVQTFIETDKSRVGNQILLQPGQYSLVCKEINVPYTDGSKWLLTLSRITHGPLNAKIYDGILQEINSGQWSGSSYNAAEKSKNLCRYIDSIIQQYPDNALLPSLINIAYYYIPVAETKKYISLLNDSQRKDEGIAGIERDFKRDDKIKKEKYFEDFSMKTIDGKDFTLSSLRNKKLILLDFGERGCPGCRGGHPELLKLYKKFADKGFEIVSVSIDTDKKDWQAVINEDKISEWINVSDLQGWNTKLVKDYYLRYVPNRFLLDGNRKVLKIYGSDLPSEKDIESFL